MKNLKSSFYIFAFILSILAGCDEDDHSNTLTANVSQFSFTKARDFKLLEVTTDARVWYIRSDAAWITFSSPSGVRGISTVMVTAEENTDDYPRTTIIRIGADEAVPVEIAVTQKGSL